MFDRIAPRYDLLNRLLSAGVDRRWRRACVDALDLSAPARVLDLCSGTADLLVETLTRDAGHRGLGVDISGAMLRLGAGKLRRRGLADRASLAIGDAERLPLRDGRFDRVMVAFGIRNVGDVARALAEARRVLRPGGRIVVLEFGLPGGPLGVLYRLYFDRLLPAIGRWVSHDRTAYGYLPASVARFPSPEAFCALMRDAGFTRVARRPLTGGVAWVFGGEVAR